MRLGLGSGIDPVPESTVPRVRTSNQLIMDSNGCVFFVKGPFDKIDPSCTAAFVYSPLVNVLPEEMVYLGGWAV